jgi:hypothetical protein
MASIIVSHIMADSSGSIQEYSMLGMMTEMEGCVERGKNNARMRLRALQDLVVWQQATARAAF